MESPLAIINEKTLLNMVQAFDIRAPYALGHFQTVSRYAVLIAQELALTGEQVETLRKAGLLHDIGKLLIPEALLVKPDRLTPEEYATIQQHSTLGADILTSFPTLRHIVPMIRHHHENYDGTGYPDKLAGEQILLGARVLHVADVVEALASDRPYKQGVEPTKILAFLREEAGKQFDPAVVEAFLSALDKQGLEIINNPGRFLGQVPIEPGSFRPLSTSLIQWLEFRRASFPD